VFPHFALDVFQILLAYLQAFGGRGRES